jgi:hypothetical protein
LYGHFLRQIFSCVWRSVASLRRHQGLFAQGHLDLHNNWIRFSTAGQKLQGEQTIASAKNEGAKYQPSFFYYRPNMGALHRGHTRIT